MGTPLALIMCPSRELAEQVMEHTFIFAKHLPEVRIMGLYGAHKDRKAQVRCRPMSSRFACPSSM